MTTQGICPLCNGTGRKPCPDDLRDYGVRNGWYGYDKANDTVNCDNCGAQYQHSQKSTGMVKLRADGTPCVHQYKGTNIGRCYNRYTCIHCGDSHNIDSGD